MDSENIYSILDYRDEIMDRDDMFHADYDRIVVRVNMLFESVNRRNKKVWYKFIDSSEFDDISKKPEFYRCLYFKLNNFIMKKTIAKRLYRKLKHQIKTADVDGDYVTPAMQLLYGDSNGNREKEITEMTKASRRREIQKNREIVAQRNEKFNGALRFWFIIFLIMALLDCLQGFFAQ